MAGLIVAPRARIFQGHDWVYGSEVRKVFGNPRPGDVVALKDGRDRYLGSAMYNPQSQIVARRFSRRKQDLDREFFVRRLGQSIALRERLMPGESLLRLVWSESDGLPGLIVDRYQDVLVVQTLTVAMWQRVKLITNILGDLMQPRAVIVRNDSPMLAAEGLEQEVYVAMGEEPQPFDVQGRGLRFLVDLQTGQKTGLYLDQLQNYMEVARWAKGRRVLDCFSNQGGFALACARAGALSVTAVDVSEEAISSVRRNAELNGVKIDAVADNAFDFLKKEANEVRNGGEPKWDLIVLDPPSFTRSKKSLHDAMRGYKEIHLRAMKMLPVGGILSTFCCSHHASAELFRESIGEAAVDAPATLRLLQTHGQSPDHPVLLNLPETEYLKGFSFELVPGR
ncbi:class I SAM-dependent rRNA methyltransferase [Akkermansia glycaniphila]|uniref:S-adenosyl-l-methionine-dependent methyltransferase n=1 Tax=Akkermansia glycaniphila TaxID=1679444 RepID=A0A1C7PAU9_9BACT|nr:class I SAM-dependent rRNA methyltransferase [Akkermansia glycaniphila]OCA02703.1 SAM-dependent methyltransferase [Akkermansia glycaniphila]SEH78710.1 s-adenosyl-l-methionine-dependent methyltransferase [Akkermansia glycaniphila]